MGNYNCQECINKEVNIINELLLENKIFSTDSSELDQNIPSSTRIKNLKASKEDLKKVIKSTNLSEEQKNYVERMINDNSDDFLISEGKNTIRLRVDQKSISEKNMNTINETEEEQRKIIEEQKAQILSQQKIIEEYKKQQLLLEEQQNKLKAEEEKLKIQIEQAKAQNEEHQEEQNIEEVQINALEPLEGENQVEENEDNNAQIIINQPEQERNIEIKNKSPVNREILRVNIDPEVQNIVQENEVNENEFRPNSEDEYRNVQILNFNNYPINQHQLPEKIEIDQDLPQHEKSKRFKIETYEPIEPNSRSQNENYNNLEYNNEIEDIYGKLETNKSNEPKDSIKPDLRRPIIPKIEEEGKEDDINNMNNYSNYVQEKINVTKKSPKDNERFNREFQFKGTLQSSKNDIENINIKKAYPSDSQRKNIEQIFNQNNNQYYFKKEQQYQSNPKRQKPLNKNEMKEEIEYKNQEININNINKNNTNPISGAISQAVFNQKNFTQYQNTNNYPLSQQEFHYVKKEIQNPPQQIYFQQQQINKNNVLEINQNQQNYSPKFNELNNEALDNNMQSLENYESEANFNYKANNLDVNMVTLGPYINGKSTKIEGKLMNNLEFQGQPYDNDEYNQQNSQKEYDMTISERDNPLIYSDDIGNMNFLERQYAAYQDKMNKGDEN